jgi:hypothetical protein
VARTAKTLVSAPTHVQVEEAFVRDASIDFV